jgi:hypothetical protein
MLLSQPLLSVMKQNRMVMRIDGHNDNTEIALYLATYPFPLFSNHVLFIEPSSFLF